MGYICPAACLGKLRVKLARDAASIAASSVLPIAISIATVPLYISAIGVERYGALAIAWVFLGYFGNLDFGIGRAIAQRISMLGSGCRVAIARAVVSSLITTAVFGILNALVVFFAVRYFFANVFEVNESLRPELIDSVWALALCNPLVSLGGALAGALIGQERFGVVSITNFVAGALMQILPLVTAFVAGPELTGLIVASLAARAVAVVVLTLEVWKRFLRRQVAAPSWDEFRRLTSFGAWVMVSAIVGPLMIVADRFVTGGILGAVAVAAYTIPFQMASRMAILPGAVSEVLFPRFAAQDAASSQDRCGQFSGFIGQIFAPVVIGLICLSGPLLHLWLGANLDQRSIGIAQIIFAGIWTNAVAQIPFSYIQARGGTRFTGLVHLAELPVYLLVLYFLAKAYGLPGISLAFSLRCALDCMIMLLRAGVANRQLFARLGSQVALIAGAIWLTYGSVDPVDCLVLGIALGFLSSLLLVFQMPPDLRERLLTGPIFSRYRRSSIT